MTVKELKKYLDLIDEEITILFEFASEDVIDGGTYQRSMVVVTVELNESICILHGE